MVNIENYNSDLTVINKYLWAILVDIFIFLTWNNYPIKGKFTLTFKGLRYVGVLGPLLLPALYRSGTVENVGWMSTSWWGILGLIGWGYLVSALCHLWLKDRIVSTAAVWNGFILLNILAPNIICKFSKPLQTNFWNHIEW